MVNSAMSVLSRRAGIGNIIENRDNYAIFMLYFHVVSKLQQCLRTMLRWLFQQMYAYRLGLHRKFVPISCVGGNVPEHELTFFWGRMLFRALYSDHQFQIRIEVMELRILFGYFCNGRTINCGNLPVTVLAYGWNYWVLGWGQAR
jgi:hypothetical protein